MTAHKQTVADYAAQIAAAQAAYDAEIIALYRDAPISVVVRKTGCKVTTIYNVLRRHGIPRHSRHPRQPDSERNLAILREIEGGATLKATGARFGISGQVVHNIARRAGIRPQKSRGSTASGKIPR